MSYSWDAETYSQLDLPHLRWGENLLEKFEFKGDEIVVEAGCGTGRDSEKLAKLIPSGRLHAFDISEPMLAVAERRVGNTYRNVTFHHVDLLSTLPTIEPADLIFSVATFHWISDHTRLFGNLRTLLEPGGVLLADAGGKGNISNVIAMVNSILGLNDFDKLWNFADVDETVLALRESGFEPINVEIVDDPAVFRTLDGFKTFLSTLILGAHTATMSDSEKEMFLDQVASALPASTVDYVRLKIEARAV